MKLRKKILCLVVLFPFLGGCVLTKVISAPMRVGGAVISILPGVGNTAHDAIDEAAERVDDIPI